MERLLQRVRPTWLVMGEKDWQQLTVLRRDLLPSLRFGPCRLVTVPVVRESDGLPCSSRNRLLSPAQRREAACLTQVRQRVVQAVGEGERCARVFTELAHTILAPVVNRIDYVELVDPATLQPCRTLQGVALFAVAVRFGDTRLIDNQFLMGRAPDRDHRWTSRCRQKHGDPSLWHTGRSALPRYRSDVPRRHLAHAGTR